MKPTERTVLHPTVRHTFVNSQEERISKIKNSNSNFIS